MIFVFMALYVIQPTHWLSANHHRTQREQKKAEMDALKARIAKQEAAIRSKLREEREQKRSEEIRRHLVLYFALCTKKPALLEVPTS